MFLTFGTLVNAGLIPAGSFVGLGLSKAVSERLRASVMHDIGLFTLLIEYKTGIREQA